MLIDSHCHLNDQEFEDDFSEVIERAKANGIGAIVVVGCDVESSGRAIELARQYDILWATVGIHPHDAKSWNKDTCREIENMLHEPKVVALGEIGLDYHYHYSTREEQDKAFREQIAIAKQYNKPIIIHNREAHQDTFNILTEVGTGQAGGVMHCFSGSFEMACEYLMMGLYLSFAGPITFNNADRLREVAAKIPIEKLLIETDSPYLTPHPFRGKRNEPEYVKWVGAKLAAIKGIEPEEVANQTSKNCRNLFRF